MRKNPLSGGLAFRLLKIIMGMIECPLADGEPECAVMKRFDGFGGSIPWFLPDKCTYAVPCPALPSFLQNFPACFFHFSCQPVYCRFYISVQRGEFLPFQLSQWFYFLPEFPVKKPAHRSVHYDCKQRYRFSLF